MRSPSCQANRLLTLAGPAIIAAPPVGDGANPLPADLASLLRSRNGFSAFLGALTVFPARPGPGLTLETVSRRHAGPSAWAFAADLWGNLFIRADRGILLVDVVSGDRTPFAADLDDWQGRILANPADTLSYDVALAWTQVRGPLGFGSCLSIRPGADAGALAVPDDLDQCQLAGRLGLAVVEPVPKAH